MNEKLMKKLGITEEDLTSKNEAEEMLIKQEVLETTLDYILTEIVPMLLSEGGV